MDGGIELSELERDAFTELVNIGVSRAAVSLRKMIGVQVLLSVPSVEIVKREIAARLISERESSELVAIHQDFEGAFAGRALLIFPVPNSLELVRAVAGGDLSQDELMEMADEALTETGNVILNACLATMANMLQGSLSMALPKIIRGSGDRIFSRTDDEVEEGHVLFLYIDFAVQDRNIRGYIAMLMDLPALEKLRILINDFISRIVGDEAHR